MASYVVEEYEDREEAESALALAEKLSDYTFSDSQIISRSQEGESGCDRGQISIVDYNSSPAKMDKRKKSMVFSVIVPLLSDSVKVAREGDGPGHSALRAYVHALDSRSRPLSKDKAKERGGRNIKTIRLEVQLFNHYRSRMAMEEDVDENLRNFNVVEKSFSGSLHRVSVDVNFASFGDMAFLKKIRYSVLSINPWLSFLVFTAVSKNAKFIRGISDEVISPRHRVEAHSDGEEGNHFNFA